MAKGGKAGMSAPQQGMAGWAQAGILITVVLLVYYGSLSGGFIWDDGTYIVGNKLLTGPEALIKIWTTREFPDFWPVSFSLFWLEYRLFGLDVTGYHVVCLVLHLVNAFLLWRILARMGCTYGFIAALIFAVHPVNVEAVAWIFQAKTTLASALAMAALLLYLDDLGAPSWGRYLSSIALFLMAMTAKASVVSWPVAMMFCAHFCHGGGFSFFAARHGRQMARIAPFFLVAVLMGIVNLWWYSGHGPEAASELIRNDGLLSRLSLGGISLWFYLGKALWPVNLAFVYPRWQIDSFGYLALLPLVVAFLGVAVIIWRRKTRLGSSVFYASGFYLVTLLPVLGLFEIYFMRYSFVADHWQYMSLMALVALAVEAAGRALKIRPRAALILATLTVVILGGLSVQQAAIYHDEETIWRDTLIKNPGSWMVHNSLGLVLKKKGRLDEAMVHYSEAARLYPQGQSYYNMALVFDQQGYLEEALKLYDKAAELNPYYNIIFTNMGIVQAKLGKNSEARNNLEKALALMPTAENHYNLGFFLENLGELKLAQTHFAAAMQQDPQSQLYKTSWSRVQMNLENRK